MVELAATDLESCERVDGSPPGIRSADSSGFPPKPPAELALIDEESRSKLIKSVTCKHTPIVQEFFGARKYHLENIPEI